MAQEDTWQQHPAQDISAKTVDRQHLLTSFSKKGTYVASPSTQLPIDQPVDYKKKGAADKEIMVDPNNPNKKLCVGSQRSRGCRAPTSVIQKRWGVTTGHVASGMEIAANQSTPQARSPCGSIYSGRSEVLLQCLKKPLTVYSTNRAHD
jgi:hypothetical protein